MVKPKIRIWVCGRANPIQRSNTGAPCSHDTGSRDAADRNAFDFISFYGSPSIFEAGHEGKKTRSSFILADEAGKRLQRGCSYLLPVRPCPTAGLLDLRRSGEGTAQRGESVAMLKSLSLHPYRHRGFKLSAMKQHRGRVTRGQKDDECPDTVKASRNSFSWGIPTITPLGR